MFHTTGTVKTAHAAKYLQQLCKHFAHKVPVKFNATTGDVSFPTGPCQIIASDDGLTFIGQSANAEGIARMKGVIIDHLDRFAWRETLDYHWQDHADDTAP
ncbi:DUF2218 domain-containing protein [Thalassospira mesophila]|uniref:2,4-dihydroxyhept-2-ene-1,7-dioic acid aldolase n=1 Tax=Thalassospira mesophila TaxID=1293891 RepID=A0A1Y2KXY9_9PROT|nr:DUF2218 domain-containing protein [Thalassospira mesophila]OSQ37240.1 2,4-dihydroxyhept-2-ene-1,7-dioic acid aldolase [Thalassospira mesophila]